FLLENISPRRRPGLAAPFDRPGGNGPAARVQDALPRDDVVLAQMLAFDHFPPQAGGQGGGQEIANFLAERSVLIGEIKVHSSRIPVRLEISHSRERRAGQSPRGGGDEISAW